MNMRLIRRVKALESCGGPREQGFDDLARALERTLTPHTEIA